MSNHPPQQSTDGLAGSESERQPLHQAGKSATVVSDTARPSQLSADELCPTCDGPMEDEFTIGGVILAILFFPIGIICCLMMTEKKCQTCKPQYNNHESDYAPLLRQTYTSSYNVPPQNAINPRPPPQYDQDPFRYQRHDQFGSPRPVDPFLPPPYTPAHGCAVPVVPSRQSHGHHQHQPGNRHHGYHHGHYSSAVQVVPPHQSHGHNSHNPGQPHQIHHGGHGYHHGNPRGHHGNIHASLAGHYPY